MSTYTVRATRWAHGWELHIDGVGVTQSRNLDGAEQMVRDYIEMWPGSHVVLAGMWKRPPGIEAATVGSPGGITVGTPRTWWTCGLIYS